MLETIERNYERLKRAGNRLFQEHVLGDVSDVGVEPGPVAAANEAKRHEAEVQSLYGIANVLNYDQYDPDTGLFYNADSLGFVFELLPQTGADEEMASRLATIFSPIPPDVGLQLCLFGSPHLQEQFDQYVELRSIAVDRGLTPPFFTEMANRRIDYVGRGNGRPLFPNENFTVKNLRLVFSVTRQGSFEDKKLVNEFAELRDTLQSTLRSALLPAFPVDADALKKFLWPILNPQSMFDGSSTKDLHYDEGRTIKEQLTQFGQHVKVKPREILFGLPPESEDEPDNRVAVRGFGVLQYPRKKHLWEMANIIGAYFDDGLQYPCPFLITTGIFTLEPALVEGGAQLKAARAKSNAKSRMAEFQPELESKRQDWEVVLHQLDQGGAMCDLYHTLLLFAPKKDINRYSQTALNIWKSERFLIQELQLLQLSALYASMPMTLTAKLRDDLRKMRIVTRKTTINAVDMAPVIGEWKGTGDPVMLFFGRRGTPTFLDFYSNRQGNYNIFVCGVSGSGKSVTMNEIVESYRSIGARAWVIDVGHSYRNLIAAQRGTFIEFTPKAKVCINPFSWVGIDEEEDFNSEMRLLKPMIARMASPNADLTEFQYALVTEAITAVWNDYGRDSDPTKISQYLLNNIRDEKGELERQAWELGKQLQPFTKDGIYGGYFNGKANLSFEDDMIGLELEELKNAPELRRVVLFTLTSRIAADMYLTRDRKKLCLIDEAWQLLGADKETAEFIEEGYRRARKYRGIFCLGTQGIEDAFKNDASRAAYNNADWKIYLRQDKKNLEALINEGKFNCTPTFKRMLLSLRTEAGKYSELLISSPNGDAIVRHIPDEFSLLMASSNADDYTECNQLLAQGYDTMQTLEIMMERRRQYA